jgi:hypothetical protein
LHIRPRTSGHQSPVGWSAPKAAAPAPSCRRELSRTVTTHDLGGSDERSPLPALGNSTRSTSIPCCDRYCQWQPAATVRRPPVHGVTTKPSQIRPTYDEHDAKDGRAAAIGSWRRGQRDRTPLVPILARWRIGAAGDAARVVARIGRPFCSRVAARCWRPRQTLEVTHVPCFQVHERCSSAPPLRAIGDPRHRPMPRTAGSEGVGVPKIVNSGGPSTRRLSLRADRGSAGGYPPFITGGSEGHFSSSRCARLLTSRIYVLEFSRDGLLLISRSCTRRYLS